MNPFTTLRILKSYPHPMQKDVYQKLQTALSYSSENWDLDRIITPEMILGNLGFDEAVWCLRKLQIKDRINLGQVPDIIVQRTKYFVRTMCLRNISELNNYHQSLLKYNIFDLTEQQCNILKQEIKFNYDVRNKTAQMVIRALSADDRIVLDALLVSKDCLELAKDKQTEKHLQETIYRNNFFSLVM